jgi:2-enoate reductase
MKLFEPGRIGRLSIKNRVVMLPMMSTLQDLDGAVSPRAIDYFAARAKGGTGLIVAALFAVEREIEPKMDGPRCTMFMTDGYSYINRLSQLADVVHDYGAKLAVQLTAGMGRVIPPPFMTTTPVGPSVLPTMYNPAIKTRELSTEEVEKLVKAFGFAAKVVSSAGVDAIELHGHEGYLIDQFMTPLWNHRTDKYGGDFDRRLRFPLEIIESIKANAGNDFPIIFRYSISHEIEGGREVEESLEIAKRLEEAGVDAISASGGMNEDILKQPRQATTYTKPGYRVPYAEALKKAVKISVIAAAKLGYPELAEQVLAEGKADFIGLGRPLLADPDWPNKVKAGRLDDLRPCLGCNEGCMLRVASSKYVSCTVNPAAGMEREFTLQPAEKKKSVLVVGGGPAGMEAARVAALRGHRVTLCEKGNTLGGNLVPASVPEYKLDIKSLIHNLSTQIKKLDVNIEMGKEATPELIRKMGPEVIIIATGATPFIPQIPGVDKDLVTTDVDLLLGKKEAGKTVVVLGAGLSGCEVAAHVAKKGKQVTLVTRRKTEALLPELFPSNRDDLLRLLTETKVAVLAEIDVLEIRDDGVVCSHKSGKKILKADTVVLARGLKSEAGLFKAVEGSGLEVYAVGDCVEPRDIKAAIWEGFRTARLI